MSNPLFAAPQLDTSPSTPIARLSQLSSGRYLCGMRHKHPVASEHALALKSQKVWVSVNPRREGWRCLEGHQDRSVTDRRLREHDCRSRSAGIQRPGYIADFATHQVDPLAVAVSITAMHAARQSVD